MSTSASMRVKLHTLSPVHVGSGDETKLLPYLNYVADRKQGILFLIDEKKLDEAMQRVPGSIDQFVEGVRSQMDSSGAQSDFTLKRFIRDVLPGVSYADLSYHRIPLKGVDVKTSELQRHLTNEGRRPFIPGSTIKGAIRTALLYDWMVNHESGQAFVERLIKKVDSLWRKHGNAINENRSSSGISNDVRKDLKEFDDSQLFDPEEKREDDDYQGPSMRFVRVSDTESLSESTLEVTNVRRFHLKNSEDSIPQLRETVRIGSVAFFSLKIDPAIGSQDLDYLKKPNRYKKVFKKVNEFYQACASAELDRLEEIKNTTIWDDIFNFYEELEAFDRCTLLRIGSGKTYFENSIGLAIRKADENAFKKFRKLMALGRKPKSKQLSADPFPATRSYIAHDGHPILPLGWVKLEMMNQ